MECNAETETPEAIMAEAEVAQGQSSEEAIMAEVVQGQSSESASPPNKRRRASIMGWLSGS